MKYKVGDKVKVINTGKLYDTYEEFIKENAPQLLNKWVSSRKLPKQGIYEVKAIGTHKFDGGIAIIEQNNKIYIVGFKGLELVNQFTKSDLKDNHIVVYENGYKEIWCQNPNKNIVNENLSSSRPIFTDIVEVWEFDKLIWKREEILDEVEKKYLSDVIRPFRDKVKCIVKEPFGDDEYITINIIKDVELPFPSFKKGTMYKNMELNKEYSLKELGLE